MESFSFYPTHKIDLFSETIEIEPYRVVEVEKYINPLEEKRDEITKLQFEELRKQKTRKKTGKKTKKDKDGEDDEIKVRDLSSEDFDLYMEMKKKGRDIKQELFELTNRVAQLGLKRALYPDTKELVGEELDKYPDVQVPEFKIYEICKAMEDMANGVLKDEVVEDEKKQKTSTPKES